VAFNRRRKPASDWVYRGWLWELDDPTSQEVFLSGSYYNPIQVAAGQPGATALVLVDSHNRAQQRLMSGPDGAGTPIKYSLGAPSQPDRPARGPLVRGCDLHLHLYHTSGWFGNAQMHLGVRIIVADQDAETGAMLQHPDYSMWANIGGLQESGPDYFANGRQNCWEERWHFMAPQPSSTTTIPLSIGLKRRPRFKRRLDDTEGLFLWVELHQNSQNLGLFNPFCRTLIQPAE